MSQEITVGSVENDVTTGAENALHDLLKTLKDFAHRIGWVNEVDLHKAVRAIDNYEKHALGVLKAEASKLSFDRAGYEDVTARVPAPPPSGQVTQAIDYQELAKAMLALQAQQNSAPGPAQLAIEPTSIVTGADQQAGGGL